MAPPPMRRILILDDDESRHTWFKRKYVDERPYGSYPPHVTCVRVYTAFQRAFSTHVGTSRPFDLVHLDYDLNVFAWPENNPHDGGRHYNGCDAAKLLMGLKPHARPEEIIVHSVNPAGVDEIRAVLAAHPKVLYEPFSRTKK